MDYDRQGLEIQRTLSGGVVAQTRRDRLGRVRFQNAVVNELTTHLWREYDWNYDHRLASITDHKNHHTTAFEYDDRGFLERTIYNRKEQVWRTADKLGNLYQSKEQNDRKYQSSQLQHDGKWYYHYDKEGNLIHKSPTKLHSENNAQKWSLGAWQYAWDTKGMLKAVQRPDGSVISFKYDAFGRRISKTYHRREFLYIWDKNVPLHEIQKEELCEDNIITWIFEGFTPTAKLINGKAYSIISDHIGTPILAIDTNGVKVWERELDIYGKVRKEFTSDDVANRRSGFMPFLYAGQYYDKETDLAYNRFRYYSTDTGAYISQDPIGLWGGDNLYAYVHNTSLWIDALGLTKAKKIATLTLSNGKTYVATSGENPLTTNEDFDKIVGNSVDEAKNKNGDVKYYGKCAEINAINEALLDGQTRDSLKNAIIDTRFNKNRKGTDKVKPAKKDDPAEACDCCKLVLKEMNIEDKNKGCGNK